MKSMDSCLRALSMQAYLGQTCLLSLNFVHVIGYFCHIMFDKMDFMDL